MNMAAARKLAHGQVAALVRVNLETGEGDLFVGEPEDLGPADRDRFWRAVAEIVEYHERREGG